MNKKTYSIFKIFFFYFLLTTVLGIIRCEIFFKNVDIGSTKAIARISSYVSNITTCFMSSLLVATICILFFYFLKLLNISVTLQTFGEGINDSLFILICGEIVKAFVSILFLPAELYNVDYQKDIDMQLASTFWYRLTNWTNYLMIFSFCGMMVGTLRKEIKVSYWNSILQFLFLITFFILIHINFLT